MGDLQVGETFRDRWFLIETATGNPHLLQTPTVVVIDESGNRAAPANATEESDGWYYYDFTPDAAGSWSTEAANAGSTFVNNYVHYFKVGGGEVTDIKTETALIKTDTTNILAKTDVASSTLATAANLAVIDGFHDVPAQNAVANVQMRDVIGNKTDTTAGDSAVALLKKIDAKTTNLPADPADDSDIDAEIATVDGFHDVPVQNSAANSQIRDVVGNKTDTTAGDSVIAILKQILEDTGTTLDDLVDDLETRLSAARAGYLDKLANRFQTYTFFSRIQPSVTVTAAAPNLALPSITLPNWTGTIVHVYAGFIFRMVENTNAGANKIDTLQYIQVQKAAGALTNCIAIPDDVFGVAATTREGGTAVPGDIDVVGTVDVFNATYNFQWTAADADVANLVFNDVQTFLIVSYY